MTVKVINESKNELPAYQTPGAAGMDLRADITTPVTLQPFERCLIPTGIRIQLPDGFEAQIRPRSGLALKHGVTVCNSPGTIDADYRGLIGVVLINLDSEPFTIEPGERIAQMIFAKYECAELVEVESLDDTERGEGGFNHTGTK